MPRNLENLSPDLQEQLVKIRQDFGPGVTAIEFEFVAPPDEPTDVHILLQHEGGYIMARPTGWRQIIKTITEMCDQAEAATP